MHASHVKLILKACQPENSRRTYKSFRIFLKINSCESRKVTENYM